MKRDIETYEVIPKDGEGNVALFIFEFIAFGIPAIGLFLLLMIGIGLAILAFSKPAHAHDHWINREHLTDPASGEWCCNEHDCNPVAVHEVAGGYAVKGETVPYSRVIWKSKDGRWWRCEYAYGEKQGKTRCLIGAPPGS